MCRRRKPDQVRDARRPPVLTNARTTALKKKQNRLNSNSRVLDPSCSEQPGLRGQQ